MEVRQYPTGVLPDRAKPLGAIKKQRWVKGRSPLYCDKFYLKRRELRIRE
jgi:hypothetical protein